MTSKLDKLLSIRTRIIGDFNHNVAEADKFTEQSDKTLVSFRTVALEKSFKEFMDISEDLEKCAAYHELEDLNTLCTRNREIQDRYLNIKIKLNPFTDADTTVTAALSTSFFEPSRHSFIDLTESAPQQGQNGQPTGIKLASIHVTPFDGKYEEWPEFKDSFQSIMKKYKGDNVEKFTHLKNYLRGEAKDTVKHLGTNNESYDTAWELLTSQYENKNAIIEGHLESILSLPAIDSQSAGTIRSAITTTKGCLAAIKNLEIMTETWDPMVVYILKKKMDSEIRGKWEEERKGSFEPAKLKELVAFLDTRHKIAAAYPRKNVSKSQIPEQRTRQSKTLHITENIPEQGDQHETESMHDHVTDDDVDALFNYNHKGETCGICGDAHRVFRCPKLTDAHEALKLVKEKQLCTNCLYKHNTINCSSKFNCKTCEQRHHTLLHEALQAETANMHMMATDHVFFTQPVALRALLATALIPVYTRDGKNSTLRALIDQGSTANLISERGAQLLQCRQQRIIGIPMISVGNVQTGMSKARADIIIGSLYEADFRLPISALITPFTTSVKPITKEVISKWSHLQGLDLADPSDTNTRNVDLLIGAITFSQIIEKGFIRGGVNEPIAQKTKLGWLTSGTCACTSNEQIHTLMHNEIDGEYFNVITNDDLSQQLKTFWEVEEVPCTKEWSEEEKACDECFVKTITRGQDGKFIMRIPFNTDPGAPDFLGDSFENAKRRFFQLERRFARDPTLKKEYAKGIHEYLTLGHAERVPMKQLCHVIPHHAVIKESSTTTKLRTVYDASAKTTNGYSLNDRMHIGPTILEDLWAVLMRWRCGKIAVIADIEKMYRQFWVHPDDTKLLQILWRDDPNAPLELLELKTVTFGTAAAPYMAIKGLHLIAKALEHNQPELALSLIKCFYVDDYLESFDSIDEALQRIKGLSMALTTYGLNLRKWQSNTAGLTTEHIIDIKTNPLEPSCAALGMQWNTQTDQLSYKVTTQKDSTPSTKRKVLSEIASLFDPLGLLAPIIMRAKAFMQQLWLGAFGWDDELPAHLQDEWRKIKASLTRCSNFRVPRWVGYTKDNKHVSLHGFCDASEKMYAAACYLRTVAQSGLVEVHLLTAKTKVAPLKSLTIPKLELCAANLLASLMEQLIKALKIQKLETYAWTDSGIVLAWVSTPPHKLKTFVSNRVAKIQEKIPTEKWRYVNTASNPADYATRIGNELIALTKWWTGPPFLLCEPHQWPTIPDHMVPMKRIPELRAKAQILVQQETNPQIENPFIERFSSLSHLLRVTAYCARLLKPVRMNIRNLHTQTKVTTPEIMNAKKMWIRHIQGTHFEDEIQSVIAKKAVHSKSPLLSLNPFLDDDKILRVRGRLERSLLQFDAKHPIFLPANSRFTELAIKQAHFRTLHGGLQITLRAFRDEFWVSRSKEVVKAQYKKCVTCFRDNCKPAQQQMADLLAPQVQPNRPFSYTGVDFAGHFFVKTSTRRNAGFAKCYVSLFICLTTKAIHLELAKNLSTEAFIAALSRFTARRGIPNEMFSDRGTNFRGTAKELPNLWYDEQSEESQLIQNEFLRQGITWNFNPARASHFGGLWEAGVKSMKTHLHRVLRERKLTYEDFNTLLIQIEACLNSRPLCPLSEDINDFEVLTPGHFLIGQAPITMPYPEVKPRKMIELKRYEFIQELYRSFWDQWSHEYLTRLQQRPKWKRQHPNLKVGQIVVIKEDNLPPTKWVLGRIMETFQGKDGLVRSAMVRLNKKTIVSRPIHKLCLLPIEDNDKCTNNERLIIDQSLIRGEDV